MVILYLSKGIFLKNFYRILGITLTVVGLMQMKLNAQTIAEGEVLFQKGKYKEAKSIFEEILKKDDKNAEAHNDLGMVYLNRRNPEYDVDKAVDETEKAVNLAPNNANIQYGYGAALGIKVQNAGIIKQAMLAPKVKKAFLRAVELNPKHIQARVALAQYYMMAPSIMGGDEEEAWRQLEEVIKLDEVQGRTVKAGFLLRAKKNDEAEKEYKILVTSKPKEWKVWHRYGYFCMHLEHYDNAIEHFKKYIELRPDTADSYQSLAEALLKKGNVDLAMSNLNKSLSLDKDFVPAIISMGEAYQAKGQIKEAKENYQRALSIAQNDYYKSQAEKKLKEVE
jgi:Tfp pilus assembly protein PilF